MKIPNKNTSEAELAQWNDEMVKKYHEKGTLFESKNIFLRTMELMRLNKIKEYSNIKKNDKLLDLGCGEGFFINLLPNNIEAYGIDISKEALKRANKILEGRKRTFIKYGDAYKTEFDDEYFNIVACSEVLEHVPEPKKIMAEIHRILKNDGIAVISVPDEERIKLIMKIIKFLKIDKFLHSARKQEEYEWHLHSVDKKFIQEVTKELFKIKKMARVPILFGYRFVVSLKKIK